MSEAVVTGLGVVTAIGQGKQAFGAALMGGRGAFDLLQRPGRQLPGNAACFAGAEIAELQLPPALLQPSASLRTASLSAHAALIALHEAWNEARLDEVAPARIGLIVGGSNLQQRELVRMHATHAQQPWFVAPSYGQVFMDSDLCGVCTALFPIRGFAYTLGAASASGQMAILQAYHAVCAGQVDVCIAIGALMDLSYWELQAFSSMGAMGSSRYLHTPALACRPFDAERDGFVFGEACGAVVIERVGLAGRTGVQPYARCLGGAVVMDGNRRPDPSLAGETAVIREALRCSGLRASQIDYVNPHGSGSRIGDETELQALRANELQHAWVNTTKSVTGHGLSAAGAVEVVATLLQIRAGQLHPSCNLEQPMETDWRFVRGAARDCTVQNALTLSFGFGGINTAMCWQQP